MARRYKFGLFACFAILFFICSGIAQADTIRLKNGGRISGTVVNDNGVTVTIDIGGGTVVQNKADIVRIDRTETPKTSIFGTARQEKRVAEGVRIKAPEPKKTAGEVFDAVMDAVKSILRFDFLRRSK